ncbi:hypothetical protein [Galbibacter sp.]|uniref:hypothetical protein n=1 Tax=Galbibacter sp. TaxID=2918471 RepID=UPI003A91D491
MEKYLILICIALFGTQISKAQSDNAQLIRGVVLYKNTPVPAENVININTEDATTTNEKGEFLILVSEGDKVAFTALNFELKTVTITDEIIENKRLVVEVDEKITELDEVIITPEDREAWIQNKNAQFKEYVFEKDHSTPIQGNMAIPVSQRGMVNGINFVNIFKALFKSNSDKDQGTPILPSQVLRQVYNDEFFVIDLKIPQDKINAFLYYVDDKLPSQQLMKRDHEFELIDFLVEQSRNFIAVQRTENP